MFNLRCTKHRQQPVAKKPAAEVDPGGWLGAGYWEWLLFTTLIALRAISNACSV
jgi:hypothetical protein